MKNTMIAVCCLFTLTACGGADDATFADQQIKTYNKAKDSVKEMHQAEEDHAKNIEESLE